MVGLLKDKAAVILSFCYYHKNAETNSEFILPIYLCSHGLTEFTHLCTVHCCAKTLQSYHFPSIFPA